ncbi:MAG: tetratricopeptide repeat protein [Terriglobia bacterium]|nr:tetratricopeptide repeat protein [Terriglobia bacterium]
MKTLRAKLKELAEQGSVGAMNLYADFAVEGTGGPQDYSEAMKWWRKSAEMDSAEGQFNLGLMYLDGEGVPADGKEGVKWLRLAADKGFAPAASRIAPMAMMKQNGLEPNSDVRKWLLTAAEAGDALSMMNLGMSYFHEIGGSADYVEAYKWFTLAMKFGADQNVIDGRPGLKPKMTAEQIAEAEKRAREWEQSSHVSLKVTEAH